MKKLFEQPLGSRRTTFRLAALLLVITFSLVASKLGEEYFIKNLQKDCNSLFSDRLVPATTLFELSDVIYQKRDTLTRYLRSETATNTEAVHFSLGAADASIEHLITAIEKTYLVDDESRLLRDLRAARQNYAEIESKLLSRHKNGETVFAEGELQTAFDQVRAELVKLTKVQQTIGEELRSESFTSATNVTTLLYLQLGVAFVLGLLASGLTLSLRPRNPKSTPHMTERMH